jgi:hypothetical protein
VWSEATQSASRLGDGEVREGAGTTWFATATQAYGIRDRRSWGRDIDVTDKRDRSSLIEQQWRLVDPQAVAGSLNDYRRYVNASRAEFMVAKGVYVTSRGGWFSDRSMCYLASGRPVVVQDTGISELLAVGDGVLKFSTPDENLPMPCSARRLRRPPSTPRRIAESHFDADTLLGLLLGRLGVGVV